MQAIDMEAKLEAVRDHTVTTGLYSDYRRNTTENAQEIKGQNADKKCELNYEHTNKGLL